MDLPDLWKPDESSQAAVNRMRKVGLPPSHECEWTTLNAANGEFSAALCGPHSHSLISDLSVDQTAGLNVRFFSLDRLHQENTTAEQAALHMMRCGGGAVSSVNTQAAEQNNATVRKWPL